MSTNRMTSSMLELRTNTVVRWSSRTSRSKMKSMPVWREITSKSCFNVASRKSSLTGSRRTAERRGSACLAVNRVARVALGGFLDFGEALGHASGLQQLEALVIRALGGAPGECECSEKDAELAFHPPRSATEGTESD